MEKTVQPSNTRADGPARQRGPRKPGHSFQARETGHLAEMAAIANGSSQVQTQLKLAEELQGSFSVGTQQSLAGAINAGPPQAAQLERLEKKPAAQTKTKPEEKKPAAQTKRQGG